MRVFRRIYCELVKSVFGEEIRMKLELVYPSGQTYWEHISAGSVRVNPTKSKNGTRVSVRFLSEKGKTSGLITLQPEEAQALGHALLLACAGDVEPIQFSLAKVAKAS